MNSVLGSNFYLCHEKITFADIVKYLLENSADINAKSNNGASSLMIAAYNGKEKVVQILLENNADVNLETVDGVTALIEATGDFF